MHADNVAGLYQTSLRFGKTYGEHNTVQSACRASEFDHDTAGGTYATCWARSLLPHTPNANRLNDDPKNCLNEPIRSSHEHNNDRHTRGGYEREYLMATPQLDGPDDDAVDDTRVSVKPCQTRTHLTLCNQNCSHSTLPIVPEPQQPGVGCSAAPNRLSQEQRWRTRGSGGLPAAYKGYRRLDKNFEWKREREKEKSLLCRHVCGAVFVWITKVPYRTRMPTNSL